MVKKPNSPRRAAGSSLARGAAARLLAAGPGAHVDCQLGAAGNSWEPPNGRKGLCT
jgi:hypothetical protein